MSEIALLLFGIGVFWLAYVYAIYPLLLALVARFARVHPIMRDDYLPSVSVLISARNEEKDIGWKIAETLSWDYPADRLEILIASDASDDRTDEIVRNVRDTRVQLFRMEKRGGKNRALNRLAEHATGDLLFFTDANSHIDSTSVRRMVSHFADERVGCVTGNSYSGNERNGPVAESGSGLYWGHELIIKHFENQFGSVLVCDGAIFCMRRQLYAPIFPELANDLELPLRVAHAGYWTRFEPAARVLEKDTTSPREEFARRRRICGQGALGMWKLRELLRGRRAWQFISQKLLRWLTLVPMLLIFCSTALLSWRSPVASALLGIQLAIYGMALAGLVRSLGGASPGRLLSVPLYIVVSAAGAFAGVMDACTGRRFDVWESPSLSRGDRALPSGPTRIASTTSCK